jgi:hypothetical protein
MDVRSCGSRDHQPRVCWSRLRRARIPSDPAIRLRVHFARIEMRSCMLVSGSLLTTQ